jgi:hypothetical protein
LSRLHAQLGGALALALVLASPAFAQGVRAAGGVELVAAVERSLVCAVGKTRDVHVIDATGYAGELLVERSLDTDLESGATLRIAWEELARARPPRFAENDRVLVCLDPLPVTTLWRKRYPDPELRSQVLLVANRGGAFLRNPSPGSLDELEHYARLKPDLRAGATGAARLTALAAQAELPIAEDAVERLRARGNLAEQLDPELSAELVRALLRPDASSALQASLLGLVSERRPPSLRAVLETLASRKPPPPGLIYEALGRFDDSLGPERTATLLRDASPDRRAAAARFASGPGVAGELADRLRNDPAAPVRAAAVSRLVQLEGERALGPAIATLSDQDVDVRVAGVRAIASLGAAAVPDLRGAVRAGRQPAASAAIAALHMTRSREAAQALAEIAKSHPDESIRKLAAFTLGEPLGEHHGP